MKKVNLIMNLTAGVIIMTYTSSAYAQEFPQWRGPERNAVVNGAKVPKKWPNEFKQIWKLNVGISDASPVITGNRLYVFARQDSSEILRCLDSRTGKELWQNKYTAVTVTGPSAALHSGPRSTPVIAEGKVVTLGVAGVLSCLDAGNGKVLWRKENSSKLVPQFYTGMSPLIAEGKCFVHLGGKGTGDIVAFDLADGAEKWKWSGEGPSYSSPVIMSVDGIKQIIFVTEKNIISFGLNDGKILWQVECLPQNRFYNAVTPVINEQTVIITGQGVGTRAIKVRKEGDTFSTTEVWKNPDVGAKYCTPVFKGGYLYGISDQRKIFCMDAGKGQTAWIDTLMHTDFGSILDCGSVLIGVSGKSEVIVLSPDSRKYTELTRVKVTESAIYAHPLVMGNLIYIKDKEDLIFLAME